MVVAACGLFAAGVGHAEILPQAFAQSVTPTPTITSTSGVSGATTSDYPVRFSISFDRPVTGFDSSDVSIGGTANAALTSFSGSGRGPYTFTAVPFAEGTITVDVPASATGVNPPNNAATQFTITHEPRKSTPTITSSSGASGDTTSSYPIFFSISFDRPVTGFDRSHVVVLGTANAANDNRNPAAFSGSGSGPYTFAVFPANNGTVTITVLANGHSIYPPNNEAAEFTITYAEDRHGQPADCTDTTTLKSSRGADDWSAIMRVCDLGNNRFGCDNSNSNNAYKCRYALSPQVIGLGSSGSYEITQMYVDTQQNLFHFNMGGQNGATDLADYHLRMGSAMFSFSSVIEFGSHNWNHVSHFLSWKPGDLISLELVKKATPAPFTGTPPKLSFLSVSPSTITEGNSATIRINLAQTPENAVTVCIGAEPGGTHGSPHFATSGTDYNVPGSIVIPAGQRTATGTLTTIDDGDNERNEIFNVFPCSVPNEAYPVSGADLYQVGSVKVTIRDND